MVTTSVRQLAEEFGVSLSKPVAEVYQSFRTIGLLGIVGNADCILDIVHGLRQQFLQLQEELSGLAPFLNCFLEASSCAYTRCAESDRANATKLELAEGRKSENDLRGVTPPVAHLLKEYFRFLNSKQPPTDLQLKVVQAWMAICWLAAIIPDLASSQSKVSGSARTPIRLTLSSLLALIEVPPEAIFHTKDWGVREFLQLFKLEEFDGSVVTEIALIDALLLAAEARPAVPAYFLSPAPSQSSRIELTERFLSRGHWDYPRPAQQKIICQLLSDSPGNPLWQQLLLEQLVISIGFLSGGTCDQALCLDVVGEDFEPPLGDLSSAPVTKPQIEFARLSGYNGKFRQAILRLPLNDGRSINLQVPERISNVLKGLVGPRMRGPLIELLPASQRPWLERVEEFLVNVLKCPLGQANRIVRDTFAREIFAQSRNAAVVSWLLPNRFEGYPSRSGARPVLTHYLDPLGLRTYETYWGACRELFGSLGAKVTIGSSNCHDHGDYKVAMTQHQAIAEELRRHIHLPGLSPIEVHNAVVDYTLLMLVVSSGHRASNTPFWFPWDIRFDDRLAFVCDKATIGSEARFVPLAESMVAMLQYYESHLGALGEGIAGSHPNVVAHIENLLSFAPRGNESLGMRVPEAQLEIGYFFKVSPDGAISPVNTRSLESAIEGIVSRPKIRNFRACIADALWGMGATGTDVATLLGHANELHPFGPASIDSVFRWADRIRPLVGRYLDERGWRPVPSPLTQGHQRSYAARTRLPNFDLGDHSYEGRNRESQLARERAKKAVVQVLSEELIGDPNQEIDGARVDEIYRRIQEQVGGDRRTKDSVLRELAKEIGRLKYPSLRASAAKLNLLRQDPSPVAITFGRHLEIASAFRREWVRRVGLPIGGPMDLTERCAQFSISLVVHAAVLDPARFVFRGT
jgi:hypothetical protein